MQIGGHTPDDIRMLRRKIIGLRDIGIKLKELDNSRLASRLLEVPFAHLEN